MQMMRIQGFSMGYSGFQKPIVQNPGLRGIFDFQSPSTDFLLAAGSPSGGGGADGGGAAPAPAPSPGAPAPDLAPTFFVPPPNYLFPVVEQPVPPLPPAPTPETAVLPTWAIVGGSMLAGLGIATLLFKQG